MGSACLQEINQDTKRCDINSYDVEASVGLEGPLWCNCPSTNSFQYLSTCEPYYCHELMGPADIQL